jgi:hypothetical protein
MDQDGRMAAVGFWILNTRPAWVFCFVEVESTCVRVHERPSSFFQFHKHIQNHQAQTQSRRAISLHITHAHCTPLYCEFPSCTGISDIPASLSLLKCRRRTTFIYCPRRKGSWPKRWFLRSWWPRWSLYRRLIGFIISILFFNSTLILAIIVT